MIERNGHKFLFNPQEPLLLKMTCFIMFARFILDGSSSRQKKKKKKKKHKHKSKKSHKHKHKDGADTEEKAEKKKHREKSVSPPLTDTTEIKTTGELVFKSLKRPNLY